MDCFKVQLNVDFKNFSLEMTKDLSPTLRLKTQSEMNQKSESMHHSFGALSETQYIYEEPYLKSLELISKTPLNWSNNNASKVECFEVAIVGLGLGYIDLIYLYDYFHFYKDSALNIKINSYEIDLQLKEAFQNWLKVPNVLNQSDKLFVYDYILRLHLKTKYRCEDIQQQDQILLSFKYWINTQNVVNTQWYLNDSFELKNLDEKKFNFVAFDAFSEATDQQRWSPAFLTELFAHHTKPDCIVSTYACKSSLRTSLVTHQFQFLKRAGFAGKRNSTLAFKGAFSPLYQIFSHNR